MEQRPQNESAHARWVAHKEAEERSLDSVQRVIVSSLILAVFGTLTVVLAVYLVLRPEDVSRTSAIMLWIHSGFIGLITTGAVLVTHRRRFYSPWVLLGLLPMAISGPWIL